MRDLIRLLSFSFLIAVLAFPRSRCVVLVRKCCPPGMVLDLEERCVVPATKGGGVNEADFVRAMCDQPDRKGAAASICNRWKKMAGDAADSVGNLLQLRWSEGQSRPCPRRKKTERRVSDILGDGRLLVSSERMFEAGDVVAPGGSGGCLEMAVSPFGGGRDGLEGPFLQSCHFDSPPPPPGPGEGEGLVTKCCGPAEVIDPRGGDCVPQNSISGAADWDPSASWLPTRRVRQAQGGGVAHRHRLRVFGRRLQEMCTGEGGGLAMGEFDVAYTDGTVGGADYQNSSRSSYICLDRYVVRNPGQSAFISQPVAFQCVPHNQVSAEPSSSQESSPKDAGGGSGRAENRRREKIGCIGEGRRTSGRANSVCVNKCCPTGQAFLDDSLDCVSVDDALSKDSGESFRPEVFSFPDRPLGEVSVRPIDDLLAAMARECGPPDEQLRFNSSAVRLLDDGSLLLVDMSVVWTYDFCVDRAGRTGALSAVKCLRSLGDFEERGDRVSCSGPSLVLLMSRFRAAYSACGALSLVFLCLTLHVYRALPALRNLHGRIVVGHVVAVFATTAGLVLLYNAKPEREGQSGGASSEFMMALPPLACRALGYSLYYAALSMFCWMSAMCLDLGWTFARDHFLRSIAQESDRAKFLGYAAIACLLPAIALAWLVVVDVFYPQDESIKESASSSWLDARPDVGRGTCFLSLPGLIKYFYVPVSVMLTFNAVAFVATVRSLWRARQLARRAGLRRVSTKRRQNTYTSADKKANRPKVNHNTLSVRLSQLRLSRPPSSPFSSSSHSQQQRHSSSATDVYVHSCVDSAAAETESPPARNSKPATAAGNANSSSSSVQGDEMALFVKIFFIMGLSFFVEVLHIMLHRDHKNMNHCSYSLEVFLRLLGIVNMLRGFFIFVIFVWKKPIRKAMIDKHPSLAKFCRRTCSCLGHVLLVGRRDSSSLGESGSEDGGVAAGAGAAAAAGMAMGHRHAMRAPSSSQKSAEEMERIIEMMMEEDEKPRIARRGEAEDDDDDQEGQTQPREISE